MECLITSLRFELFENIIPKELDSTLTHNVAIALAKRGVSLALLLSSERL